MTKWKVTINGTGKLGNSPKMINEVFELDENTVRNLSNSSSKEQVIKGLLLTKLPGVEVDVSKLSINREEIRNSILKNETVKNIGKSAIAGAIGGAIAIKTSKRKKDQKVEVNEDEEKIIKSFAHELTQFHNISYSNNVEDITNKLDEIYYGTKGYKWKFASDGVNKVVVTENNRSLSKCVNKFEHGLKLLQKSTEEEELKKEYNKKYRKLKLKKILNKFGLVIGLVLLFFILILTIWITE
jgi:hypothetical protein